MAIASLDDLVRAMASGAYRLPVTINSSSSQIAGQFCSRWRSTSYPPVGAIPTAAAVCDASITGAMALAPRTGAQQRVIAKTSFTCSASGHALLIEDRLMHMGGLSGTVTTAQTVNVDLHANLGTSNLAERVGPSDYSEVSWYLEWYAATGATVTTPTAAVTFHDGTTGTVNIFNAGSTALPASVAIARRYVLAPTNGKFIRSVQSVTLSATTGTVGNFGVTAACTLTEHEATIANSQQVRDWTVTQLPLVADNACLTLSQMCSTTTSGSWTGTITQAVG